MPTTHTSSSTTPPPQHDDYVARADKVLEKRQLLDRSTTPTLKQHSSTSVVTDSDADVDNNSFNNNNHDHHSSLQPAKKGKYYDSTHQFNPKDSINRLDASSKNDNNHLTPSHPIQQGGSLHSPHPRRTATTSTIGTDRSRTRLPTVARAEGGQVLQN